MLSTLFYGGFTGLMKNFGLIGAAGYIAPRHLLAIKNLGHRLVVGYDLNDSVGILDSISSDAHFFSDFERFFDFVSERQSNADTQLDWLSVHQIICIVPCAPVCVFAMLFAKNRYINSGFALSASPGERNRQEGVEYTSAAPS